MNLTEMIDNQRNYFKSQATKDYHARMQALQRLYDVIVAFEPQIYQALKTDLNKSELEAYTTEIGFVLSSIKHTQKRLKGWMKDQGFRNPIYLATAKSYIHSEPYGVMLIMGPFNYPFQLTMEPLVGAIAAGNTAVIKPSEYTPHVATIIQAIVEQAFSPELVTVVQGGVKETTDLLAHAFDYIFFTGSPRVGKIVMQAASRYLTPVTLELGGKSPAIVTATANLKEAAEQLVWGKFLNAGQTCVAPDYLLVDQAVKAPLINHMRETLVRFYGEDSFQSDDYGRLATQGHAQRLAELLQRTRGEQLIGGTVNIEARYISPTLVDKVEWSDPLMDEELFGPILPILTYEASRFDEEVIQLIENREKPLALYLFNQDKAVESKVINRLSFGGGVINGTILQLSNDRLPFGGVGQSGMGHYHGKFSFDAFSHQKAIVKRRSFPPLSIMYPPYTKQKLRLIRRIL